MEDKRKKSKIKIANRLLLILLALVLIGSIIGYFYWPKQYSGYYLAIVALLILNIGFIYGFIRHNNGKRGGRSHHRHL